MGVQRFDRPLEIIGEPPRSKPVEVTLNPPEEIPKIIPAAKWRMLLPLVMVLAVVGMVVMMFKSGSGFQPMYLMFPLIMLASMGAMFTGGGSGQQKGTAELNEDRKEYLIHLNSRRETVTELNEVRHEYNQFWLPNPTLLGAVVGSDRQWRHRKENDLFLIARIGLGRSKSAVKSLSSPKGLESPEAAPAELLDPLGVVSVSKFVRAHTTVGDVPIRLGVGKKPYIGIRGDADRSRALVRAVIAHLAVFHGPDDLHIAAIVPEVDAAQWQWTKWLPHTQGEGVDALGSTRKIVNSVPDLIAEQPDWSQRTTFMPDSKSVTPHLIVVVDDAVAIDNLVSKENVTWIVLGSSVNPEIKPAYVVEVDEGGVLKEIDTRGRRTVMGTADALDIAGATLVARRLSRYRVDGAGLLAGSEVGGAAADSSWESLVGIKDPGAIVASEVWTSFGPTDKNRMTVALGVNDRGRPVMLDFKEGAMGGTGPHGMLIGFTGSGKSELLLHIVLSLIARHSPDELNLILIDYKGGATFSGFERLRHVLAVVTNMSEEAVLVTRLADVLEGEIERRERMCREAGEQLIGRAFKNRIEYEEARRTPQGAHLPPMPTLMVIIDEFTDFLKEHPDMADAFVKVGRKGRAYEVHLFFATQHFQEGQARGLETHLSYRIALKTTSAADSRAVIGVPDAYHLPETPGAGYLKTNSGGEEVERFQAPYSGGPYVPPDPLDEAETAGAAHRRPSGYVAPMLFTAAHRELILAEPEDDDAVTDTAGILDIGEEESGPDRGAGQTFRDNTIRGVVLDRLSGQGRDPHQMWLPPVDTPRTLGEIVTMYRAGDAKPLTFPVGLIDNPRAHAQHPWVIDTADGGGHFALVGAGMMGKSVFVKSLILGAAATHAPETVQFFVIDPGGQLGQLAGLPHVGVVARDDEHMRRALAVVMAILASRERMFADLNIHSIVDFRKRRAQGDREVLGRDRYGDVYLVVDGYEAVTLQDTAVLHNERDQFQTLVTAGANYGVHLLVTGNEWVRLGFRNSINQRAELRLSDPFTSEIGGSRERVRSLPALPGRALSSSDDLHRLVALPRLDERSEVETLLEGTAAAVDEIARAYGDRRVPRVRALPRQVAAEEILAATPSLGENATRRQRLQIPFAVGESNLQPVAANLARASHMQIYGAAGSGKSTALAAVVRNIQARLSADEAKIVLVDPRRQHMELIDDEKRQIAYASSIDQAREAMKELAVYLSSRVPGPGLTPQQKRARSWWQGPEILLVIDDYHMVQAGTNTFENPFVPLVEHVQHGHDIGFHVVVARNIQGANVAVQLPFLAAIRAMSSCGLILNGDRQEGSLVDSETRPAAQHVRGRGIYISPMEQIKETVQAGWVQLPEEEE